MNVCFLIEGGQDAGLGHVYNSTALSGALSTDANPMFLTTSGEQVVSKVTDFGHEIEQVDTANDLAAEISRRQPDSVVIDRPDISETFLTRIYNAVSNDTRITAIGDLGAYLSSNAPEYCDAVVDLDIGSGYDHAAIKYDERSETLHLVGVQHFILRPQFYRSVATAAVPDTVENIMLMFGASDPSNYTARALGLLMKSDRNFDINVVLGPGYTHSETSVTESGAGANEYENVTIERDVSDIASRMQSADLLLTSPGLTMIEALFLRTPVVAFRQNTIQELFKDYDFVYPSERMDEIVERVDEFVSSFDNLFSESNFDPKTGRTAVVEAVSETDRNVREIYNTMRSRY